MLKMPLVLKMNRAELAEEVLTAHPDAQFVLLTNVPGQGITASVTGQKEGQNLLRETLETWSQAYLNA